MQLLLHPESDDSAQLSQVLWQFIQILIIFTDFVHFILFTQKIFADWDWEASGTISWDWNEQAPCKQFSDFYTIPHLIHTGQSLLVKWGQEFDVGIF